MHTVHYKIIVNSGGFEADADVEDDDESRDQRGPGTGAGLMSDDQRAGLKKVQQTIPPLLQIGKSFYPYHL